MLSSLHSHGTEDSLHLQLLQQLCTPGLTMHGRHLLSAVASQHCVPSLHRVRSTVHLLYCISHHCGHVLQETHLYVAKVYSPACALKLLCDMGVVAKHQNDKGK